MNRERSCITTTCCDGERQKGEKVVLKTTGIEDELAWLKA